LIKFEECGKILKFEKKRTTIFHLSEKSFHQVGNFPSIDTVSNTKMNETLRSLISEKFKNTPLGFLRIKKNLRKSEFTDNEIEMHLRMIIISTPLEDITTKGKNHYFKCCEHNSILTINANTFTVITAKQIGEIYDGV